MGIFRSDVQVYLTQGTGNVEDNLAPSVMGMNLCITSLLELPYVEDAALGYDPTTESVLVQMALRTMDEDDQKPSKYDISRAIVIATVTMTEALKKVYGDYDEQV